MPPTLALSTATPPRSTEFVRWIQRSLNQALGRYLLVDGIFGPKTREAVMDFQRAKGLKADGIVGQRTEAALVAAAAGTSVTTPRVAIADVLDGFAFGQAGLQPGHLAALGALAGRIIALRDTPQAVRNVIATGHTDPVGSDVENHRLGLQRAESVRRGLAAALERVQPGASERVRIDVASRGEREPVPGSPERSRRVQLVLLRSVQPLPSSPFVLPPDPSNLLPPARANVDAQFIFPARRVIEEMQRVLATNGRRQGAWIYLLNWHLQHDLSLPGRTTLIEELEACAKAGATIRALVWSGGVPPFSLPRAAPPGIHPRIWSVVARPIEQLIRSALGLKGLPTAVNQASVSAINSLSNAKAHLDDRTLSFGSHHQKLLVVGNADRVVAVMGGVDWNADRLVSVPPGKGKPLFDVSVRVDGEAAVDLARAFELRWVNHPQAQVTHLPTRPGIPPATASGATVQVGVNYGCARPLASIKREIIGASNLIDNILENCRRYFYLECQYGIGNTQLQRAIAKAFEGGASLGVVLLAGTAVVDDFPEVAFWRHQFWSKFPQIDTTLLVFERWGNDGMPGGPNAYVHSKLAIVDDEAASVGTLNLSRRGWRHDSEMTAVVSSAPARVAGLRRNLWPHHLTFGPADDPTDLGRALDLWRQVHRGTRRMPRVKPLRFKLTSPPPRLVDVRALLANLSPVLLSVLPVSTVVAAQGAVDAILDKLHSDVVNPVGPPVC